MILIMASLRKLICQAQELHMSKINDFVNEIIHGIELSGRELQRSKINQFLNRILHVIELSECELQR